MNRFALTTALILSTAAPALAQSQLEQSLDVPAGKYTTAQLVELKGAAEQTGNDSMVHFETKEPMTVSSSGTVNMEAAEIIRGFSLASDDGIDRISAGDAGTTTGGIVNDRAQSIVQALIVAGDEA